MQRTYTLFLTMMPMLLQNIHTELVTQLSYTLKMRSCDKEDAT
jgi:hypothetical protein